MTFNTSPLITHLLLSRHLSFNNRSHTLSPARSLKGIANKEQLNTREFEQSRVLDLVKSYLPVTKELCPSSVKKVHRTGSQPFDYQMVVTLCIKGPSEMPFVFDMVGLHHIDHLIVSVDTISHSNMLSPQCSATSPMSKRRSGCMERCMEW